MLSSTAVGQQPTVPAQVQPVPATDAQRADRLLGRRVVDGQSAVGEINAQGRPLVRRVGDCLADGRLRAAAAAAARPASRRTRPGPAQRARRRYAARVGPGQCFAPSPPARPHTGRGCGPALVAPFRVGQPCIEEVSADVHPAADMRGPALIDRAVPGVAVGVDEPLVILEERGRGVPGAGRRTGRRRCTGWRRRRRTPRRGPSAAGRAAAPACRRCAGRPRGRTRSHISRYSGSSTPAQAMSWSQRVDRVTSQPSRPRIDSWR